MISCIILSAFLTFICIVNGNKEIPVLPNHFEATVQFIDSNKKRFDNQKILYDGDRKIVMYSADLEKDSDEPFIGKHSTKSLTGHLNVIHDFLTGLQFIVSDGGNVCKNVSAIPSDFGDVENVTVKNSSDILRLKQPAAFFYGAEVSNFTYNGTRVTDSNVTVDVFRHEQELNNSSGLVATELLFTDSDWSVEGSSIEAIKQPVLYEIRRQHLSMNDNQTIQSNITYVNRIFSLVNLSRPSSNSFVRADIETCLSVTSDSYLYAQLTNTKLEDIKAVGFSNFDNSLAQKLSDLTNVSTLRFPKFFLKEVSDTFIVLFPIGDLPEEVKPASTESLLNQTTMQQARDILNKTLNDAPIKFDVIDNDGKAHQFELSTKSLGVIPSKWGPLPAPPKPESSGYSGGSMFALAVFMFLLGASGGVGGAFILWKRQRTGGLTYQVFE